MNLEYIKISKHNNLSEYLITMISTSKTVIPTDKLVFIGNYFNVTGPKNEYIPDNKISIIACNWSLFEKTLIDKYYRLN
ncbi:hypothetical protein D3C72_2157450 [compost metagenome]